MVNTYGKAFHIFFDYSRLDNMKAVLFSAVFLLAFLYHFYVKKNRGINVIVFSIPFSYTPFFTESFGEFLPISVTGILVVLCYILSYSRRRVLISNYQFRNLERILLFYLFSGLILAFLYYKDVKDLISYIGELPTQTSKLSPIMQVVYNASNLIISLLFLNLLRNYFQNMENVKSVARVFSLTIIPIFFYQILQMTGNSNIFGGIFTPAEEISAYDTRYFSFYTIFGFGMYISMVVAFSLYFKFKYYFLTLISALLFGLFSGERQALIFPFIVIFNYYILDKGNFGKKALRIISILGFVYLLLFILKDHFNGISRLWISIGLTQDKQILEASGRDVQGIPLIIGALTDWPILGKGLYNWGYFIGVHSYYADHVIFFNIYQKFGLFGFLLFIGSTIYLLLNAMKDLLVSENRELHVIILSLIVCFIGMQFLDNFFWFTNTMLLYILMFGIIFSLNKRYMNLNLT